ncbi:MAG: hypothetical protein RSD14_00320 [Clostridia bacterium]
MIITVYVNVSFTIKAQEQEMYYNKIINSAAQDAANQMKEVENSDQDIDYGYSGSTDKKVSVNAQVAVDTFLNSLYNNLGIKGNANAEHYLQMFIPAIAIIDYNGVQVSSIETFKDNSGNDLMQHALKPKRYYTYSYSIKKDGSNKTIEEGVLTGNNIVSTHTIDFSLDDYIVHRGMYYGNGGRKESYQVKSFYIGDSINNKDLYDNDAGIATTIVNNLNQKRQVVIADSVIAEMGYAVNANNSYAKSAGISYNFSFPPTTTADINSSIDNIGMMAFVQGLSVGNKYLNSKAYGLSKLDLVTRFYLTAPSGNSKFKTNLYHKDVNCPEYSLSIHEGISPRYTTSKQAAAALAEASLTTGNDKAKVTTTIKGFYPCPICNP